MTGVCWCAAGCTIVETVAKCSLFMDGIAIYGSLFLKLWHPLKRADPANTAAAARSCHFFVAEGKQRLNGQEGRKEGHVAVCFRTRRPKAARAGRGRERRRRRPASCMHGGRCRVSCPSSFVAVISGFISSLPPSLLPSVRRTQRGGDAAIEVIVISERCSWRTVQRGSGSRVAKRNISNLNLI